MEKETKNAYLRAWRAKNKERLKARKAELDRLYYQNNPEKKRAAAARWAAEHPDEYKANQAAWRASHKDEIRQYHAARDAADPAAKKARRKADYDKNEDRYKERARAWREANANQHKENKQAWKRANHALVIAAATLRKKYIKQRTPAWADLKAIAAIYSNCPPGHHVDHITPLRGKKVNGLHIETNLQYLPDLENLRKGNKFHS
jgi:hypothetical protein